MGNENMTCTTRILCLCQNK